MTKTSGNQILPFYAEAQAIFPLYKGIPCVIDNDMDGPGDGEGRLEPSDGQPHYWIRKNYPPAPEIIGQFLFLEWLRYLCGHELGHPYEKLVIAYFMVKNNWTFQQAETHVHKLYWDFRGFRSTWEQTELEASAKDQQAANSGWQYHPRESWAEAFGAAFNGYWPQAPGQTIGHERTFNDGKEAQPMALRAFFLSLTQEVVVSQAFDTELTAAYNTRVAPICTNLVKPRYRERTDTNWFLMVGFDIAAWVDEITYPQGMVTQPEGVKVHEHGHVWMQHLGRWYPGGWWQARNDFLVYHGADPNLAVTREADLIEIFAEHFAGALVPGYDYVGYPALRGVVPFISPANTQAWMTQANALSEVYAMARMIPRVVAVSVDANGDTPKPAGQLITNVAGLQPGIDAQGHCQRVGYVGSEVGIGDFTFIPDKTSQAWGKLHARGAKGGSTIYVMVSAIQ